MAASDELSVLVVSPLGRDADLIRTTLTQSGIQSEAFQDIAGAVEAFRSSDDVGALLVAEEALGDKNVAVLATALLLQSDWSDLPVLVLVAPGKQMLRNRQLEQSWAPLGKVTLLERPMHRATLMSSVKAALRARSRQYERKLAEEALRKSDKLAIVGRLASSIAHEINNPLEAIGNALYLLSSTALNPLQQEYLDIARQELDRVTEIASHTLMFNRHSNKRAQASVPEILDSVLMLYRARLAGSKIAIERRYQNTIPLICYPGELRQVFANLIGNAFDAMRGGGRIVLRERAVMHPKTCQHGIRITVADTGHGMSAGVKAKLFEAFLSTKGNQGTGLGLWVSKGIIDKHCGSIRVRSSAKNGHSGTVFSIFIPLDTRGIIDGALPTLQKTEAAD